MEPPLRAPPEVLRCFGCGPENPDGLRLQFFLRGDAVESEWVAERRFEGWAGVMHGAVTTALHDEAGHWAMVALASRTGVTTDLAVRFLRPLRVGERVLVRGRVAELRERSGTFATEVVLADGTTVSTARLDFAFLGAQALERALGAAPSARMRTWLAGDHGERRRLLLEWSAEAALPRKP